MLNKIKSQMNLGNFVIIGLFIIFIFSRIHVQSKSQTVLFNENNESEKQLNTSYETKQTATDTQTSADRQTSTVAQTSTDTQTSADMQTSADTQTSAETQTSTEAQTSNGALTSANMTTRVYNLELGRYIEIAEFNLLTHADLMTFVGVGEVTANAILKHISTQGHLSSYEQLMDVKGIGPKKLEKILNAKP